MTGGLLQSCPFTQHLWGACNHERLESVEPAGCACSPGRPSSPPLQIDGEDWSKNDSCAQDVSWREKVGKLPLHEEQRKVYKTSKEGRPRKKWGELHQAVWVKLSLEEAVRCSHFLAFIPDTAAVRSKL